MSKSHCFDLAIVCPDIMCPRCSKPYQTWVWKDDLLFTCPDCNELGFTLENIELNENSLPEGAFMTEMEWPCEDNPDPTCVSVKKMLFIEDDDNLKFLGEKFTGGNNIDSYAEMQKRIGEAYERILQRIRI